MIPNESKQSNSKSNSKTGKKMSNSTPLPLSASFSSVSEVASQLMKHCLGMEVYDCGVLVCEAVSNYQKARIQRRNDRLRKRESIENENKKQVPIALQSKIHDKVRMYLTNIYL